MPPQDNASLYTLASIHSSSESPLLSPEPTRYGSTSTSPPSSSSRIIFNAALKMAAIFSISTLLLGGTLYLALPSLDDADRPLLRIPKSFVQLQELNGLLKKYRDIYPYQIVVCYVTTYLFLQAFSLPGSMYLSILGGAVWGVARALPLACTCVATGASLCYLISAALGPALLTLPKWKARLDKWSLKIQSQKDNIISFLIVLRIAPLPPHWVINIICPHVGIGIVPFWTSTFLGVFGVSVIHTTIGGGLDEMTSADDFHLISWRNFLGLSAVVIGVLIPVGLRYFFKRELDTVSDIEQSDDTDRRETDIDDQIIAVGPRGGADKGKAQQLIVIDDPDPLDEFFDDDDSDSDIILESGPMPAYKDDDGDDDWLPSHTILSRPLS